MSKRTDLQREKSNIDAYKGDNNEKKSTSCQEIGTKERKKHAIEFERLMVGLLFLSHC